MHLSFYKNWPRSENNLLLQVFTFYINIVFSPLAAKSFVFSLACSLHSLQTFIECVFISDT